MVIFFVKLWCIFYPFRCVAVFWENWISEQWKECVAINFSKEAFGDPVSNLKISKKEIPGNKAASLAKELMKKEMGNQYKEIFEVFGGKLAYWLLPLVNTNSEHFMVQQSHCRNYLAVGQSPEIRAEW